MASKVGIVKDISGGAATAVDSSGNKRTLNVGDVVYLGEIIKTDSPSAKVVIALDNGKEVALVGEDTLLLDQSAVINEGFGGEAVADVSAIQQALLNGMQLQDLEETAAGGGSVASSDGVSLSQVSFLQGGHISNVNAMYGNLDNAVNNINPYQFTSGGGRVANDPYFTIPAAPTVVMTEDINNDGVLNNAENGVDRTTTTATINVPSNSTIGDTLNITVTNPDGTQRTHSVIITQDIKDRGYIMDNSTADKTIPVQDGRVSEVSATITNQAGNESPRSSDSVRFDTTTPPAPTVVMTEDGNDDGILNITENGRDTDTTTAKITVPSTATIGDTLNITVTNPNGTQRTHRVTITQDIKDHGYLMDNSTADKTIPVQDGKVSKVSATISNPIGNESPESSDSVKFDTTTTLAPTVTITEDTNNDGILNKTENGVDPTTTTAKIEIPANAVVGDTLNVTVTNPDGTQRTHRVTITQDIKTNGYIMDNSTADKTVPVQDGRVSTVSATITNQIGNESPRGSDSVKFDTTTPAAPTVVFTEDLDNSGLLSYSENKEDHNKNVTEAKVTVPSDATLGDTLKITVTNPDGTKTTQSVTITQEIIDHGYSLQIQTKNMSNNAPTTVSATITNSIGNESPSSSDTLRLDVNPVVYLPENYNGDRILTPSENIRDGDLNFTTVKITIPEDARAGDDMKITMTYTDKNGNETTEERIEVIKPEHINNGRTMVIDGMAKVAPGVKTGVIARVVDHGNGDQKSEDSNNAEVTFYDGNIGVEFNEKPSKVQASGAKILSRADGMTDQNVNETNATITIPYDVKDGDKLVLKVEEPGQGVVTKTYTIKLNAQGIIESIKDDATGSVLPRKSTKPISDLRTDDELYKFEYKDLDVRSNQDTKITATVKYAEPQSDKTADAKISIEAIKEPGVIFEDAKGGKVTDRTVAEHTNSEYTTTVTIKIPNNAVNGDKLTVTIKEPQADGSYIDTVKHYTIEKDNNKSNAVTRLKDSDGHLVDMKTKNSFEIKNVPMRTDNKTIVEAEISDARGIEKAKTTKDSVINNLDAMEVKFDKDVNQNLTLSRAESAEGGNTQIHKTTASIKLPYNIVDGDKLNITVKNKAETSGETSQTKTYTLQSYQDADGNKRFKGVAADGTEVEVKKDYTVQVGVTMDEGYKTVVEADVSDGKGGKAAAKNNSGITPLYDDMYVAFAEDENNDGSISAGENAQNGVTTATVKLPSNIVNGDKLDIDVKHNGVVTETRTYTIKEYQDPAGNKKFKVVAADGTEVEVKQNNTVEIKNVPISDTASTGVDAKVTGADGIGKAASAANSTILGSGAGHRPLYLGFEEDVNRNGKLTRTEADLDGNIHKTNALVTIPSNAVAGDKVQVSIKQPKPDGTTENISKEYSIVGVNPDGSYKVRGSDGVEFDTGKNGIIKVPVSMIAGKETVVGAKVVDSAGAQKEATADKGLELTPELTNKNLSVSFDEDNANRNGVIDRSEASSDNSVLTTTVSVTLPNGVVAGDKLTVNINGADKVYTFEKSNGKLQAVGTDGSRLDVEDDTVKIKNVPMQNNTEIVAKASLSDEFGIDKTPTAEAKNKLNSDWNGELSARFEEDLDDDGKISRVEDTADGASTKTTIAVGLPSNIINGDKLNINIKEGGVSRINRSYTIEEYKDANGVKKFRAVSSDGSETLEVEGGAVRIRNVGMRPDDQTKVSVEATLTDAYNHNRVTSNDEAVLEKMQNISTIGYNEETNYDGRLTVAENSRDGDKGSTGISVYLPDDTVAGDKVVVSYTDPHDASKTITKELPALTSADIDRGYVSTDILINTEKDNNKVNITAKTVDQNGNESATVLFPTINIEKDTTDDTITYKASQERMYGGLGKDTLVFEGSIDLSQVNNLDHKVESFEELQLGADGAGGAVELTISAKDVLDITDNADTILKIKGDQHDTVKGQGQWKLSDDQSKADAGYKMYDSVDSVDGKTVHIQIDEKIHTDF